MQFGSVKYHPIQNKIKTHAARFSLMTILKNPNQSNPNVFGLIWIGFGYPKCNLFLFTFFKNIIFLLILHKNGKIIGLMQNYIKNLKLYYENY